MQKGECNLELRCFLAPPARRTEALTTSPRASKINPASRVSPQPKDNSKRRGSQEQSGREAASSCRVAIPQTRNRQSAFNLIP